MVASWGRLTVAKPIFHQEFMVSGAPAWTVDFEGRPVRLQRIGISFERGNTAGGTSYVQIYVTYPSFDIVPGLTIMKLQADGLDSNADDTVYRVCDFCLDLPAGARLLGYGTLSGGIGVGLVDIFYEYLG